MIWVVACVSKNTEPVNNEPIVQSQPVDQKIDSAKPRVLLDGVEVEVQWDDGDTFHGVHPDGRKIKARLKPFKYHLKNHLNTI